MITLKLNFDKIDQTKLFKGKQGRYLDITLLDSHGDRYGNDFMVVQDLGAEARKRGERGPILGNGKIKHFEKRGGDAPAKRPEATTTTTVMNGDDNIPF